MYAVTLYAAGFNALLSVGVYDVSSYLMEGPLDSDDWRLGVYCWLLWLFISNKEKRLAQKGKAFLRCIPGGHIRLRCSSCFFSLFIRSVSSYISFGGFGLLLSYVQDYGPAAAIYVMVVGACRQEE